jgi:hypothetical protein
MKLVEELSGSGELTRDSETLRPVRYLIRRYQGMAPSGLPIPGLFRVEGKIQTETSLDLERWIDVPLTLRLEDGRAIAIVLADQEGRVLSEGHGPTRCLCC